MQIGLHATINGDIEDILDLYISSVSKDLVFPFVGKNHIYDFTI